jgi:hypothetical protein
LNTTWLKVTWLTLPRRSDGWPAQRFELRTSSP